MRPGAPWLLITRPGPQYGPQTPVGARRSLALDREVPVRLVSPLDLRLAPMAGVTNAPFRLVARECGAGRLTSEEIDARALLADSARRASCRDTCPRSSPSPCSSWAPIPTCWPRPRGGCEAAGADGIDLNMGCPVPKIVAKGQGSALMRDPLAAAVIFRTHAQGRARAVHHQDPRRLGRAHLNAVEIARLAEDEGVDAITVHPRTRSQQFTGRAPWDDHRARWWPRCAFPSSATATCAAAADAAAMVAATGCAAVMVGRGALGAPWLFSRGAGRPRRARAAIIRRHCALIEAHFAQRLALIQLKKHLAWYTRGLPFAAPARPVMFAATPRPRRPSGASGREAGGPAGMTRSSSRTSPSATASGAPAKTLTDAHFMFFAGMTGDAHPIHYDDEYAKRHRFGRRLAHGLLLTSLTAVGASTLAPLIEASIVAFVEQTTRFLGPAFVGDTHHPGARGRGRWSASARPASSPCA